jgi:hypothetical protein
MAIVRVRFSPGFPLGGGFPAEQFAPRGGTRPQKERRGAPAEFYCSLEEGVPGNTVAAILHFGQEIPLSPIMQYGA